MKNFYIFNLLLAALLAIAAITAALLPYSMRQASLDERSGYFVPDFALCDSDATGIPSSATPFPPLTQVPCLPQHSPADTIASSMAFVTPAFRYHAGRVQLMGKAGTRSTLTELSVSELTEATLPPLDQGMVNVTGESSGYRMLPDGMVFNGDISIVLPYDSTLLPMGYTPNDIVTYYYDVSYGRWIAIERDSVSETEALVYSKVNHFTDFINAIIKAPEMPETSAFTPTGIKELEAANPLEGLQLIQAPTANNSGTANLSYQLEIPPGRQGMQPNLALTYNSSGGNGWLGVGWDIPIPSITVDTRWGVPRYEAGWESEVYMYGGEQLVTMTAGSTVRKMPHRTNMAGQTNRLPDGERFYMRAGESHDSIVRHGNGPTNYWWEVVDRNGVTSYYGAYPPCDTTQGPTCIGGSEGIARWALAATVDPNGNMVKYHYSMDLDAGAGGEMGKQLYLDSISYTGHLSVADSTVTDGLYTVVFNHNGSRSDIITNGRNGFKEVTAATLCNIQVKFRDELLRTFFFVTDNTRASNFKTRLEHFVRVDDENTLGHIHFQCLNDSAYHEIVPKVPLVHYDFEYYDYPSTNDMFSEAVQQNLHDDGISSSFVSASYGGTALGATKGKSWGLGGTATIGYGLDVIATTASGGGNFGYNRSKNTGLLALIDLDGDGLADKVYKKNRKIYYRPQVRLSETNFEFGQEIELMGIRDFLLETGNNVDFGLQLSVVALAASGGVPASKATTTNYFSDINADGRPDLVTKEGVYFNCLNSDGTIHFTSASDLAAPTEPGDESYSAFLISDNVCDTFFWDGEIDPALECGGSTTIWDSTYYNSAPSCFQPASWGKAILDAGDTMFSISGNSYFHFADEKKIYRYSPMGGYDTLNICGWTPWAGFSEAQLGNSVQIGNCTYTRIGDKIMEKCPRTVPQNCTGNGRDPDIDAVRVWIAPMDGSVKVTSHIRLLPDSSESRLQSRYADGISYTVQHSHGIVCDTFFFAGLIAPAHYHACLTSAYDQIIIGGDIGADDMGIHNDSTIITVSKGDMIFFDLNSKENHSFDKVDWKQEIAYQNMSYMQDQYGKDKRYYDSENDFLLTGESYFVAPQAGRVIISGKIHARNLTHTALVRISKIGGLSGNANYTFNISAGTNYTCSLAGTNSITWTVDSGTVIRMDAVSGQTGQTPNWSALTFDSELDFISTFNGVQDTLRYHLPLRYEISDSQVQGIQPDWLSSLPAYSELTVPLYRNLFGSLYRGWGQFGYNNNTFRLPDRAIRLNRIALPHAMMAQTDDDDNIFSGSDFGYDDIDTLRLTEGAYMESLFESRGLYNPLSDSTSWVQVVPYPEYGAYMSYGDVTYFSRDTMANSRMVNLNFRDADEDDWDIPEYESVIPVSTDGFPVRTIRKQNESVSGTGSFGANVPCGEDGNSSVSLSASGTLGYNRVTADCMDMNGDGFPDFITDRNVQYTMPWGGIEDMIRQFNEEICYTEASSRGQNFGASCLTPKRETKLKSKNNAVMFTGSGNMSANLGDGEDDTKNSYMDINGDGLPDMVRADGDVRLNLGYGFTSTENWGNQFIRKGNSLTSGGSVGLGGEWEVDPTGTASNFDFAQASISGGIGITLTSSSTDNMLMDINGDGLPDQVSINGSGLSVSYNSGGGDWLSADILPATIGQSTSIGESLNVGVTAGFTFLGAWKLNFGVQSTPQSRTFTRDHAQLVDINGDGYPDIVSSENESSMTVRYNQAGKTNLLKKVTNFCGGYAEMDYELSTPCYEQPQRQWNLITVSTGQNAHTFPNSDLTTLDSIEYRNPNYNRYERIDYGYDTVIVRQYSTMNDTSLYRFTVQGFNNRSFFKRGWKNSESICDADGKMWLEKLYHAILMDWEHPADTIGDGDCAGLVFTSYEAEITRYYEGLPAPQIVTEIVRQYDSRRNVIQYINKGDTTRTDEYFVADISYRPNHGHNLISLPETLVVKSKTGTILQKRYAGYDSLGNLQYIELLDRNTVARCDFSHDAYGNLTIMLHPKNHRNQRMAYQYAYDTVTNTYPVLTHDVFGYKSHSTYDYRFGKPLVVTDLNGNEMHYHYDEWGRLDTLVGPNEVATNKPYTITMKYHPYLSSGSSHITDPASYAVTSHYDPQHVSDPIQTFLYCDGQGRLLQTKKDADVAGTPKLLNSGRVEQDCFGRTIGQYHPFASNSNDTIYNDYFDPATLTTTSYDILDRPVKGKLPTGDSTCISYGFGTHGGKTYFLTTTADANGIPVSVLTGTRKQQVKTIAPMGAITTFTYDPLGQLLSSTDPCNHSTTYAYDWLGRLTSRTHPDAGTDTYTYDSSGNMLTHATQILSHDRKNIRYYYTYNRLDSIVYPDNPQNNVRYAYGDSTAGNNQRGRIALVEDASGFQTFKYGRMGEVVENNRTFVLPNEDYPYSFKMKFSYDSWNRIQSIAYPDEEIVDYKYDAGGQLYSVQGSKSRLRPRPLMGEQSASLSPLTSLYYYYNYIDSIRYNEFELKTEQWYGNGTHAQYRYDSLQRLDTLRLFNANGARLQDISYGYDAVGNVIAIRNSAGTTNSLGGTYTCTYAYDSLYRLISAAESTNIGLARPKPSYSLTMSYASDGRIMSKQQSGTGRVNGSARSLGYSYSYQYNTTQPHTVQSTRSSDFTWDANGNMLTQRSSTSVSRMHDLTWNEENRLVQADMPSALTSACYMYDADGERFYKNVGTMTQMAINSVLTVYRQYESPVLYASPYIVVTPQGYTKHYFAESERVASRIGDGKLSGISTHVVPGTYLSQKSAKVNAAVSDSIVPNMFSYLRSLTNHMNSHHTTYWQHGDHLGSASWVTDTNGLGYQHLQYTPWGEPFIEQHVSGADYAARYTFSCKERDEETGFSYFGARHYNSALSLWLSVDPLSDNTPGVTPYAYCVNNPIRIIDSDGRDWFENEKTGDVYYSRDYHKGDEHLIDGEGWKWMGKNGMFGKSDHSVISEHFQQAEVFAGDDEISRAAFSGDNAKSFMSDMGYDKKPLVQDVKVIETTLIMPDAMGPSSFTFTDRNEIVEKTYSYTYVPRGLIPSYKAMPYRDEIYCQSSLTNRRTITSFEHREYNYYKMSTRDVMRQLLVPAFQTISKML